MSQRDGTPPAPAERIAAWRATGAHRHDPVRFRQLEAMYRRVAALDGEARRRADERLGKLVEGYQARLAEPGRPQAQAGQRDAAVSPLRALLDDLARAAASQVGAEAGTAAAGKLPAGVESQELKAVRHFKRTWTRLSADQRLTQALAKVPENAGPLNSNHLVHRALLAMREISPEYLHCFIAYVDAMLWLDDVQRAAFTAKATAAGDAEKKPSRSRRA